MASTPEPIEPSAADLAVFAAIDPAVLDATVGDLEAKPWLVPVVAKFASTLQQLPAEILEPRESPQLKDRRVASWALFEAWVAHKGFEPTELTGEQLVTVAIAFGNWLRFDCGAGHPLLGLDADGNQRQGSGYRKSAQALRPQTLVAYRGFIASYVAANAGREFAEQVTWLFPTKPSHETPGARTRVDVSLDGLAAMVEVLDRCGLEGRRRGLSGLHSKIWHARQKAALLVQTTGVLRICEVPLHDSNRRVHETGTSVVYRINSTKTGPGRDVRLPSLDGSPLCPLTAINKFHELCLEDPAVYDRNGVTVPYIPAARWVRSVHPEVTGWQNPKTRIAQERKYLKWIAAEVDVDFFRTTSGAAVPDDFLTNPGFTFGTHSLRRLLPSEAANKGYDLAFISTLGGGAWTDPTHSSMVNHYLGMKKGGELSQSLLDEIHAEMGVDDGEA